MMSDLFGGGPLRPDWRMKELEIQDLFSPAAPINEASAIAGRIPQIRALTDAMFERGRHSVLFGERGVGKTSIATTFHMMISSGLRSIISIRKAAYPGDTYSMLWRKVFSDMHVDGTRVSDRYPDVITPDDVIRELGGFSLNTLPVIILDEFDQFDDEVGKRMMAHTIKALSDDRACNATVVIVGVAEDVRLLISEHSSISRNISEIKMPRMSDQEMVDIINQRYPKLEMTVDDRALKNITGLSRGLPEYVHYLGRESAINAVRNKRLNVIAEDTDAAIRRMVASTDQTLEENYNEAILSNKKNNLYKQVLLSCALAKHDDLGRFTPSDVLPQLTKILGRSIKIANFFPHLEAFCSSERGALLEKRGVPKAYKYRFKEPKMQPYVIMKGVSGGLIPYDLLVNF